MGICRWPALYTSFQKRKCLALKKCFFKRIGTRSPLSPHLLERKVGWCWSQPFGKIVEIKGFEADNAVTEENRSGRAEGPENGEHCIWWRWRDLNQRPKKDPSKHLRTYPLIVFLTLLLPKGRDQQGQPDLFPL